MLSNLLRVKRICIGVNMVDSGIAGRKQESCDEISTEMKNTSVKSCWKKNFIEKHIQILQNLSPMWMELMKLWLILEDQLHFLITCIWEAVTANANRTTIFFRNNKDGRVSSLTLR